MGTKRYVVRDSFNFRTTDSKGNEKVYSEGDIVTLEQEFGDTAHQLQYADDKDRAAALKAEQESRRVTNKNDALQSAPVAAIDHDALGEAIAQGIARAFAAMQGNADAPPASGGASDQATDKQG